MPNFSNLLRDMAMSSTENSRLNLNYTPSSSKSQKHTTTTISEVSDTASLSSQKTLVGKVFGRKSSESSKSSFSEMKGNEAEAKEVKAAARAHYFATL